MRMSSHARAIALWVLGLQLLAGVFPGSSLVLCIAADGHTAVEAAHVGGRCLSEARRHHPDATDAGDLDQHSCVDVVLAQQPQCAATPGAVATDQVPLLPGTRISFCPPSAALSCGTTVPDLASESRLSAHRTIVLIV